MSQSDAYLSIAESVLQSTRRPMSASEILREAYFRHRVPNWLHGRTQHKTLGARLSEDILSRRRDSHFFRVKPGRFFLRTLVDDDQIPAEFKIEYIAKRRMRQLEKEFPAYLDLGFITQDKKGSISPKFLKNLIQNGAIKYARYGHTEALGAQFNCFGFVRTKKNILTYRIGAYRSDKPSFAGRRTIGFVSPICHDDYTLFDFEDHGAVTAALTAAAIDLDLEFSTEFTKFEEAATLQPSFLDQSDGLRSLVAPVEIEVPAEYRFYSKRLSINELEWLSIDVARSQARFFDPWSERVLECLR